MKIQFPNGNEYSDDGSSRQDMNEGGHRVHLFPMVQDTIEITADTINEALAASKSAQAASQSATNAANSVTNAQQWAGSAQGYANDAKGSAERAEAAAKNAESSDKLPLTGGTLTGDLTLYRNPTANLHATTKQYVDQLVSNSNPDLSGYAKTTELAKYLPLTGATMSANSAIVFPITNRTTATPMLHVITGTGHPTDTTSIEGGGGNERIGILSVRINSPISTDMQLNKNQSCGVIAYNARVDDGKAINQVGGYASFIGFNRSGYTVFGTGTNNSTGQEIEGVKQNFFISRTFCRCHGYLQLDVEGKEDNHVVTKKYIDTAIGTCAKASDLSNYLLKSGGQLTNFLILHNATPTNNLHPASKQYVDTTAAKYLPLSGGTLTNFLTLHNATPTNILHPTSKQYVDNAIGTCAKTTTLNNYVPKTGTTMTGLLTLSGNPTANNHAATKSYVDNRTAIGQVILFPSNDTPPPGTLLCDGSRISRTTYAALFAVIGTRFGVGDGSTTFQLPNPVNLGVSITVNMNYVVGSYFIRYL